VKQKKASDEDIWRLGLLLPDADKYALAIRWVVIIATGLVYLLAEPQAHVMVSPIVSLLLVSAYSIPISFFTLRDQPIAKGNPWWLILADMTVSLVAVLLTGGHLSAFFLLFLLVTIEVALAYSWRIAMVITVIADALQLAASMLNQVGEVSSLIVVNRFVALLLFGTFSIIFVESARKEETERYRMAIAAAHERTLNEIFLKLGESSMNLERVLNVILESAQKLLNASCAMVLLQDVASGGLRVAASSTSLHPAGQVIDKLDLAVGDDQIFVVEGGNINWPDFAKDDEIRQMIGARLLAHTQEPLGWIVMGRDHVESMTTLSRNFIRVLAMEAGFAIHNAWLYKKEQEHVERLEKFKAMRSTFFSAVGHELKTPLTVLKTLSPSLGKLQGLSPETQTEIIEVIQQNLNRLETLVTDMLESARLEANAIKLYPVPVHLESRVHKVVAALLPLFSGKGVQVQVNVQDELPPIVADARRVDQVLYNLLNNAAKFAPPGSEVAVTVKRSGRCVVTCVDDAGPGVPLPERGKIFDKFYTSSQDKALVGVGLGLYISRELVKLHGGEIWIEDSAFGGSRFCFTLPMYGREDENGESV